MKLRHLIALSIATSLVWPVAPAGAAPPKRNKHRREPHSDPPQPDPAIIEEARVLSDEAFLRFDTRDYAGAVALWREAEQLLPLDPLYAAYRRHFTIQIAYAYKQSYEFSGEFDELAAAREQFEVYRTSLPLHEEANRRLITAELEEIEALAEAAEREALARRQEAYDDYLEHYARPHGVSLVYPDSFAIGRNAQPDKILSGAELLEHMGRPDLAKKRHRLRTMSFAGWGLSAPGFIIVFFSLPMAILLRSKIAAGLAGGGGALLFTGLSLGINGTVGLQRMDLDRVIDDHNSELARERGLIELPSRFDRPPRLSRFERATGFRVGVTIQGLQL